MVNKNLYPGKAEPDAYHVVKDFPGKVTKTVSNEHTG